MTIPDESRYNSESRWRIALARQIAPLYSAQAGVRAVLLTGGVVRGRGDRYSDFDLAVFWDTAPDVATRRALVGRVGVMLGTPVEIGYTLEAPLLSEESVFVGGGPGVGFKLDVTHRTVAVMERIIEDVTAGRDGSDDHVESLYSIQRVLILHGEALVRDWQTRAAVYPEALALQRVTAHLAQLETDLNLHAFRGDLLLYYQVLTEALEHIVSALFALNRIYRPQLKRLDDLCRELTIAPPDLSARVNALLRIDVTQGQSALDALLEDVFALVAAHLPQADVAALRARCYGRRRLPFVDPPPALGDLLS